MSSRHLLAASLVGTLLLFAGCGDDRGSALSAAAEADPSTTSTSSTSSSTSTSVESTSTSVEPTTSMPVETTARSPGTTKTPRTPATEPPETTPPTTEPPAGPIEAPTDFTLELAGTASDCGVVDSPCWNIKASWRGGDWWYNLTPTNLVPTEPRLNTLPLGPTFYPQDERGKYYLHFRMRAGVTDCAWLRAMRVLVGERKTPQHESSELVQACVDTPAIPS